MAVAFRLGEENARGWLKIGRQARVGLRLDVGAPERTEIGGGRVHLDGVGAAAYRDAHLRRDRQERVEVADRGIPERDSAARDGGGDDEGPGLDAIRDHSVLGASQPATTLDLDAIGRGPLDLSAHVHQEGDQVIDLGLSGGRLDDGVPDRESRRQHGVLSPHHRDLREVHTATAQPAGGLREVVAVAVLDLGAQGPHRVDVQVHGPAADPVPAGVADDDAPETCQQRAEQDEAGPHLGRRLEGHEQPLGVAAGNFVDVGFRMIDGHADVL